MKTYDCYSYKMMKKFLEVGIVPISINKHYRTLKTFWRYELTKELSEQLTIWSKGDPEIK